MSKLLLKIIPSRLRIKHNISYEVLYVDSFPNDPSQVGECRSDPKQIVILRGMSPTETWKTFLHEATHSFSNEYPSLNFTERQVIDIEEGVFRMLKLNKVFAFIFKFL